MQMGNGEAAEKQEKRKKGKREADGSRQLIGSGLCKGDAGAMQGRCMCDARAPHWRCAKDPLGLTVAATRITR